ncbi:MAG: FAD-dependent monooxygenase [Actinobacteria bacterium]|nr:FAD-dependent monooxygenase [Actinomycetota bacterium]
MVTESRTSRPEVAIVGAGPVGLLLAGELAGSGIRVIVLERSEAASDAPRANGVVGRSAVDLARRGVLKDTRLRVLAVPRFSFGPLVLRLGLRGPLHILPVPQRRLEQLLETRATRLGAEILRGHEVTTVAQSEDAARLEIRHDGSALTMTADYAIGCDGAHSLVRHAAGIAFPGLTDDDISRIARVTIPRGRISRTRGGFDIPGVGPVSAMHPQRMPGGSFSIAPAAALDRTAPRDLYLISTRETRGDTAAQDPLPVEELRASLRRVLGTDLPFADASNARSVVGNCRLATAYRSGRLLLAGDAAHVFNAGGASLNVGFQDAFALSAALTAVLRQCAAETELDAYADTRHAAGERAIDHTRIQAALSADDENARALNTVITALLSRRSGARTLARLLEEG